MQELLGDFRQLVPQGRPRGLIYYSWAEDEYGIYAAELLHRAAV